MNELYREVGLDPCSHSVGPTKQDEEMVCLDCGAVSRWTMPVVPCEHGNYAPHVIHGSFTVGAVIKWKWCPGAVREGKG